MRTLILWERCSQCFQKWNSDDYFESIGIKYINSVRNIFQLGLTIMLVLLFHVLIVIPIYYLSLRWNKNRCFRKFMKRVLLFFTLTFYIRTMLESFLLVLVSYFNEFWTTGVSYSCSLLIFWVLFCMVYVVNWIKLGSSEFDFNESYFRELFSSLKENWTSRAYFGVFLMRRLVLAAIIFATKSWSVYVIASVFALPSLWCLGYYWKVRPFRQTKDNLIEIINEFSFNVFWCALIYFNRESVWSDFVVNWIIYFLLTWSLICLTIQVMFIWTLSISKLWKKNSSINRIHVINDHPNLIRVINNTNIEVKNLELSY